MRALIAMLMPAILASCMVIDTAERTSSKVISDPAPWRYIPHAHGGSFYDTGIRVDIGIAGNITGGLPGIAIPKPKSAFPINICTRVEPGTKFEGMELEPSRIIIESQGVRAHAVLEFRLPDFEGGHIRGQSSGPKEIVSCWNLGFGATRVDRAYSYTIRIEGLSAGGQPLHFPAIQFDYTPKGKGICIIPGCFASH